LVDEYVSRQRNIVFPDTVRNGRSIDSFLWNGSPNPTRVQRIGAWTIGMVEMVFGLEFFAYAVQVRVKHGFSIEIVVLVTMSLLAVLLGIRTFRNGFPRPPKPVN
jgi:hypothetical protein